MSHISLWALHRLVWLNTLCIKASFPRMRQMCFPSLQTLDDAETLAANFPYEWNAKEQSISRPLPRPTYRPEAKYADSTWPSALKGNVKGSYSGAYKGDISAYRSDTTGLKGNISSSYTGAYPGESSGSYLQASDGLQRATDELLNSTYSLMYEMKRLKHERSDNPIRL